MTRERHAFDLCILLACSIITVCRAATYGEVGLDDPIVERGIPHAGADLTGVFTKGQTVRVPVPTGPAADAIRWRLLNDRGDQIRTGPADRSSSAVDLGRLEIGWYRIEFLDEHDACLEWTTAAVLAELVAPIAQNSPICVDSATAWFAPDDIAGQRQFAQLAALAGVNWVRDRLRWRDLQPVPDQDPEIADRRTTYDTAAQVQAGHGLKVLQVFHDTPEWAVADGETRGRFAADLRHVYRFCNAMARRFHGRVHAWEPWNEANVSTFGGHTSDEICSYQKAAYLGFKAGDPNVIVGWNVTTAVPTRLHTRLVLANETWPYFDTYNIHTYDWPDSYERLWRPAREAACGRAIWVTESDRGMKHVTPGPWYDLSRQGEIRKAEFMAQSYCHSLFAGASRHFHFILGHYCEGGNGVQFGLLRLDRTPRPSYVALAALGRLLAGATCLGRSRIPDEPHAHVYAFSAEPDGENRDVLVAWAERPGDWNTRGQTVADWTLPKAVRIKCVYDYLGRSLGPILPEKLRSAPVFVLLERGDTKHLPLETPQSTPRRPGTTCPVVLQLHMPRSTSVNVKQIPWASDIEHMVQPESEIELPLFAYNFSREPVRGKITVLHAPTGWRLAPNSWAVALSPMERTQLPCRFFMPERSVDKSSDSWITLRGDFGAAGKPVLAFRLISQAGEGYEADIPRH